MAALAKSMRVNIWPLVHLMAFINRPIMNWFCLFYVAQQRLYSLITSKNIFHTFKFHWDLKLKKKNWTFPLYSEFVKTKDLISQIWPEAEADADSFSLSLSLFHVHFSSLDFLMYPNQTKSF